MNQLISLIAAIYIIIILGYILMAIFIMYHLSKYSFYFSSKKLTYFIFTTGALILLFINLILFISISWTGMVEFLAT